MVDPAQQAVNTFHCASAGIAPVTSGLSPLSKDTSQPYNDTPYTNLPSNVPNNHAGHKEREIVNLMYPPIVPPMQLCMFLHIPACAAWLG